MPRCGIPNSRNSASLYDCVFLNGARETRAAKTIFHVSRRQARCWPVVVARSGWPFCGRGRDFLFRGSIQRVYRKVVARSDLDCQRRRIRRRIADAGRGHAGGGMFSRDRVCLDYTSNRAITRRQAHGLRDDHRSHRSGFAWAWSFFSGWTVVWTPRNRYSSFLAFAGSLTAW